MNRSIIFYIILVANFIASVIFAQSTSIDMSDIVLYDQFNCGNQHILENSIAVSLNNPNIMLNVNNSINGGSCGILGLAGFYSTDGGTTWHGDNMLENYAGVDPVAIIDNNSNLYICSVNGNNSSLFFWNYNGTSWDVYTIPQTNPCDKPHATIDNNPLSSFFGNIYVAYTKFDGAVNSSVLVTKSDVDTYFNNSWATPQDISYSVSPLSTSLGVNLSIGPNGEVYAVWSIVDDPMNNILKPETRIGFSKSLDGGSTWESQIIQDLENASDLEINGIHGLGATAQFDYKEVAHNTHSFPTMSVNQQTGELFIAWDNFGIPPPLGNNNVVSGSDVYIIKSTDNGDTWSTSIINPPIRVNTESTNDQWHSWLACDAVSGILAVIYFDCRNYNNNYDADVYVSLSNDNGSTWSDYKINDNTYEPFDPDGSDYIGINIVNNTIYPVWSSIITDYYGSIHYTPFIQPVSINCPTDLSYCNITETGDVIHKSSNSISVGGSNCSYVIPSDASVIMHAGLEITLAEGFDVTGEFDGYIKTDCTILPERTSNEISQKISKSIHVYPNPASNSVTIDLGIDGKYFIQLINSYGNRFFSRTFTGIKYQMNITNIPTGIYFVLVVDQSGQIIGQSKLIVQ